MSKVYGLTGGIASGKSTVLEMFKAHGCNIFDADQVARQVVEPGTIGLSKIAKTFGNDILMSDGQLNRRKLGEIVFSDEEQLAKLNQITGPLIRKQIVEMISTMKDNADDTLNIFEVQLLFESSYEAYFNATITVYVDYPTQLKRLMNRNNLTEQAAKNKISAQMSMEEKKRRADYLIDTTVDMDEIEQQVVELINRLKN